MNDTRCAHRERNVDGICVSCGDCAHYVILNLVCMACGATDIVLSHKAKLDDNDAPLIPTSRLRRRDQ